MRPYGIPRTLDLINPDGLDIAEYGLKGYRIKPDKKAIARRRFKRLERQRIKKELKV